MKRYRGGRGRGGAEDRFGVGSKSKSSIVNCQRSNKCKYFRKHWNCLTCSFITSNVFNVALSFINNGMSSRSIIAYNIVTYTKVLGENARVGA